MLVSVQRLKCEMTKKLLASERQITVCVYVNTAGVKLRVCIWCQLGLLNDNSFKYLIP